MGEDPGTGGAALAGSADAEQIREQIEETREQLGDTVEALSAKTDVKTRTKRKLDATASDAKEKVDETLGRARELTPETAAGAASGAAERARQNPLPVAAIAAFAAGFVAGRITRR